MEPLLDLEEIQGNSLAGFNKDHQAFLFLRMAPEAEAIPEVKAWIAALAPCIATAGEVLAFNDLFRSMRQRRGCDPPGVGATWINIAFSLPAIRRLAGEADAAAFTDVAFQAGLATQSGLLGDPEDRDSPGHPGNWKVGGPGNEADILVILASDFPEALAAEVTRLRGELEAAAEPDGRRLGDALKLAYLQCGATLPEPLTGREHFGFRDGVSQPGVRGRSSDAPGLYVTARILADPQPDEEIPEFSRPGQPLVWPGQFVFGYPRQSKERPRLPEGYDPDAGTAPPDFLPGPGWARNGSYLVFRRLRQDVRAFREAVASVVTQAAEQGTATDAATVAARMVGRWPSGTPLMRSPLADTPDLADNHLAINHFGYVNDTAAVRVLPGNGKEDRFPQAVGDRTGATCPFSAHVRKVNPRDTITEQGSAVDTLGRMILRRGIPYGPPYREESGGEEEDRGLLFLCYQSSLDEQFELLQRNWANHRQHPNDAGGHDPIIGQAKTREGQRLRAFDLPGVAALLLGDWVIPTGGGYFFSPSISALREVLGTQS